MQMDRPAPRRLRYALVYLVLFVGAAAFNWPAFEVQPAAVMAMNDVSSILEGYHLHPFPQWWHWFVGPWIEVSTPSYRPLSSLYLALDCWLFLRWGTLPLALLGTAHLALNTLLCALVAWQFTRWKPAVLLAVLLALGERFYNDTQPYNWLVWFPVHHDLLNITWMLLTVYTAALFSKTPNKRNAVALAGSIVGGLLTKEFAYIFPMMALAVCWRSLDWARAWKGAGLAIMLPLLAYGVRKACVPHPYMPPGLKFRWVKGPWGHYLAEYHFVRKPFLNLAHPFYRYVDTGDWPAVGFVLLTFVLLGLIWRLKGHALWSKSPMTHAVRAPALLSGALAVLALYTWWGWGDAVLGFMVMFDITTGHYHDTAYMLATLYSFYLLIKYRNSSYGLVAILLLTLSYAPVFTLLGWHYWLPGGYMRAAIFWPIVASLAWRDLGLQSHPLLGRLTPDAETETVVALPPDCESMAASGAVS